MKTNLIFVMSCVSFLVALSSTGFAQKAELQKDQNPRFQESRAKYLALADSLTRDQGTTVQDTYHAYDWYEAREERRALRRERNHELNLLNRYYYSSPYAYPSVSYGNYGFGGGFGYGGHVGYNWGNNRPWCRY